MHPAAGPAPMVGPPPAACQCQVGGNVRVAFFVHKFPAMSETFVINLAVQLIDRGHELSIVPFVRHRDAGTQMHADIGAYALNERVLDLGIPETAVGRIAQAPLMAARGLAGRLPIQALNPFRFGRRAASLRLMYECRMLKDQPPFDIIHCQFGTLAKPALQLRRAANLSGKIIVHFRGFDISKHVQENGAQVYDTVFQKADFFIANCRYFKEKAISIGCPEDRIDVLPSGIDGSRFPFRERTKDRERPVRIATVGRLVEKKGIRYAIEAMDALRRCGHTIEYTIAGDGPLYEDLANLIGRLHLDECVRLVGELTQAGVTDLLAQSDLFVAPSVTSREGDEDAPINTLKEAMSMGLPVVSTVHGGIPELVEDGVSGHLVPQHDAEALAGALLRLLDTAETWPSLGRAGRAKVIRDYDLAAAGDKLVSIYQRVMSS